MTGWTWAGFLGLAVLAVVGMVTGHDGQATSALVGAVVIVSLAD